MSQKVSCWGQSVDMILSLLVGVSVASAATCLRPEALSSRTRCAIQASAVGRSGVEGVGAGAGGAAWGVACLELGGVHQQRGADATRPSPEDDPRAAGPEATLLELQEVSDRAPPEEIAL